MILPDARSLPHGLASQPRGVRPGSLRTQSARHRVDHGTICGRSCVNSGHCKPLCACVDRTKFVAPASVAGVMAPGCCRSLRFRLYGFEFVSMGHFWLVDCVDCVERCYIQTFPFLFPSFMPLAPFALLPSVTAIACIVFHFAHDLVSKCFHDADD